jgi:hypothetical protein
VTLGEMVEAEAVRPAGARAGSEVLWPIRAIQRWLPGRDDEGVFGLRRWRLVYGTLTIFLGVPRCC